MTALDNTPARPGTGAAADVPDASRGAGASPGGEASLGHPVYYWNQRALDLVALDHSIPAAETMAPGPCASSRALGLIHAAIADAVAHAYPSPFAARFSPQDPGPIGDVPPLFVGGAAYAISRFIYGAPVFSAEILDGARDEFMGVFPASDPQKQASWDAGVRFGGAAAFTGLWDEADIKARLMSDPAAYVPPPQRAHRPDPWNPGQGFYGQRWGSIRPLVLDEADVAGIAHNELKAAPPIDQDELDLLIAKGGRFPKNVGSWKARTKDELDVGLFWAYDGVRLLGTPPVLYNLAVRAVAQADGLDIPGAARLLALSNLAMADSAVVAWEAKWRIALWRPVVGIQALTAETRWQPYGSPRSNRGRFFSTQGAFLKPLGAGESLAASQAVVEGAATAEAQDAAATLLGASPAASFPASVDAPSPAGLSAGTRGAEVAEAPRGATPAASPAPPDPEYARAAFTPNFPSYPSGHATFGGACFDSLLLARSEHGGRTDPNAIDVTVTSGELDGVTTDNYDPSRRRDDVPMTFKRLVQPDLAGARFDFDLAALTGGIDASRVFLGVHWSFDQKDGDVAGRKVGQIVHAKAYAVRVQAVAFHRYFDAALQDHFYTTNLDELGNGGGGYVHEEVQCFILPRQVAGSVPLHRYFNEAVHHHFYTTDFGERGNGGGGYAYEGVQGWVAPHQVAGSVPLHRYFDEAVHDHFYTTDFGELGNGGAGYAYEGVQCYVWTAARVVEAAELAS